MSGFRTLHIIHENSTTPSSNWTSRVPSIPENKSMHTHLCVIFYALCRFFTSFALSELQEKTAATEENRTKSFRQNTRQ